MATSTRYCWIKVVAVEDLDASGSPAQVELSDFGVWSAGEGTLRTLFANPQPQDWGTSEVRQAVVVPTTVKPMCSGCPTVAGAPRPPEAARFMTQPPAPMDAAKAMVTQGWQLECGTVVAKSDTPPPLVFACRPVHGGRDKALEWLASAEGVAWVANATAYTLMADFVTT